MRARTVQSEALHESHGELKQRNAYLERAVKGLGGSKATAQEKEQLEQALDKMRESHDAMQHRLQSIARSNQENDRLREALSNGAVCLM